MAFLDFMAYAQGAEQANKLNWQDVMNDLNVRKAEEALRQSQTTYDLGLPLAQSNAKTMMETLEGNRRAADFQTSLSTELAKLQPQEQVDFAVKSARNRLAQIDATRPGSAQEIQGIQTYITRLAADYAKAGDVTSATKLFSAIPGANVGQKLGAIEQWRNPVTALDQINIIGAGGKILPDGNIEFQGFKMSPAQFAQMQLQTAQGGNVMPGFQNLLQQQQIVEAQRAVSRELTQRGIPHAFNDVTGQITPLPVLTPNAAAPAGTLGTLPPGGMSLAPTATPAQTALAALTAGGAVPAAAVPAAAVPAAAVPAAPAAAVPAAPAASAAVPAAAVQPPNPLAALQFSDEQLMAAATTAARTIGLDSFPELLLGPRPSRFGFAANRGDYAAWDAQANILMERFRNLRKSNTPWVTQGAR